MASADKMPHQQHQGLVSRLFQRRPEPGRSRAGHDDVADGHCGDGESRPGLRRCLGPLDLTTIGIGTTLGSGVYVVIGQVAKETAGPAVLVSLLLAALASLLAGLCYAELGARMPGSGSCYLYAYVCAGELPAALTGWSVLLAYALGAAGVAVALSGYLDSLCGGRVSALQAAWLATGAPEAGPLASSVDLLAGLLTLGMTLVIVLSVRGAAGLNGVFTCLNLCVIVYVAACGAFRLNLANWAADPAGAPLGVDAGAGGFAPFGWSGILQGAGTCFFAFIGFDTIAATGDEARNPRRDIPLATLLCLLACSLAYATVSAVLTLVRPYYSLDASAPLTRIFADVGWPVAAYAVAVGAVLSLLASLFGAVFPMPRVAYSMARDGLLFPWLGGASRRLGSPLAASAACGLLAASAAAFLQMHTVLDLASIGTLSAYTVVASCVLLRRLACAGNGGGERRRGLRLLAAVAFVGLPLAWLLSRLQPGLWWHLALAGVLAVAFVVALALLARVSGQRLPLAASAEVSAASAESADGRDSYRVPCTPFLPAVSVLANCVLLLRFPPTTWLIFAAWTAVGVAVYACWGYRHSRLRRSGGDGGICDVEGYEQL